MAIVINGSGTVTGLAVGGLPDGTVDAGTLATNSVDSAELIDGAVDNSHMAAMAASKLTGALPAISGASLTNLPAATPSAGDVVQTIAASSAGGSNDSGAISWRDTHLTLTITPEYSNSKILLTSCCQVYMNNTSGECNFALDYRRNISGGADTVNVSGSTETSTAQHRSIGNGELTGIYNHYRLDAPSTTSAITYTLRISGSGSANTIWGWQDVPDVIVAQEIKV